MQISYAQSKSGAYNLFVTYYDKFLNYEKTNFALIHTLVDKIL